MTVISPAAHEVVQSLRTETRLPERHLVPALQYLIKIGALIAMPLPIPAEPRP